MKENQQKYIRWSENCVWQPVGETLFIVKALHHYEGLIPSEEKSRGKKLNMVGKDIWDLCDGTRTMDEIVNQLMEEYTGDPEEIHKDVQNAVSKLMEEEFLVWGEKSEKCHPLEMSMREYPTWDDNVLWNQVEDEVVVINNVTGLNYGFREEVAETWKLCSGKRSLDEILSMLGEKGIINEEKPPVQFKLLIKQFIKIGVVTMRKEPAS
ncbi:MAG: PqqD family protein [Candidatus Methanofastidiosia archaeon]